MQIPVLNDKRFYVYEHLRKDTGAVFYVGKGQGGRAHVASRHHRNEFWQRVVSKAGGFDVRMVIQQVDEEMALLVEVERIDQLRRLGASLCNLTNGGEGTSGLVRSDEWRAKIGASHRGKVVSLETRIKISDAVRRVGYKHSPEVRARMSEFMMGKRLALGRTQPSHEREMRAKAAKGNRSRTGQTRSAEERAKVSIAMKDRPQAKMTCPHCNKQGGNAMRRWHFDACKVKP
jgi:NUMOD3 motif